MKRAFSLIMLTLLLCAAGQPVSAQRHRYTPPAPRRPMSTGRYSSSHYYFGENMYYCRMGYMSPVFSRDISLEMLKTAAEEQWPIAVHDCSNHTKFARDLNLRAKEGGWFGQSSYGPEFDSILYEAFLPVLEDPDFTFVEEEPLPPGYRPGDIVL